MFIQQKFKSVSTRQELVEFRSEIFGRSYAKSSTDPIPHTPGMYFFLLSADTEKQDTVHHQRVSVRCCVSFGYDIQYEENQSPPSPTDLDKNTQTPRRPSLA